MGLPGKRLSSRRRKTRASHHALKKTTLAKCPKCNKPILPHTACAACGYYKGRNVFAKATSKSTKTTKKVAKTEATAGSTTADAK